MFYYSCSPQLSIFHTETFYRNDHIHEVDIYTWNQLLFHIYQLLNILKMCYLIGLIIFRIITLNLTKDTQKDEREILLSGTKIPLSVLIIDIFSIVVFLTTFFIPVYTFIESLFLKYNKIPSYAIDVIFDTFVIIFDLYPVI